MANQNGNKIKNAKSTQGFTSQAYKNANQTTQRRGPNYNPNGAKPQYSAPTPNRTRPIKRKKPKEKFNVTKNTLLKVVLWSIIAGVALAVILLVYFILMAK